MALPFINGQKANTATAHKLARMVYFMLTRGEAAALGFQINPVETGMNLAVFSSVS